MQVLEEVAARHGLACLLHEKPFAGVNGSGKHNNFSLGTDEGVNLFNPQQLTKKSGERPRPEPAPTRRHACQPTTHASRPRVCTGSSILSRRGAGNWQIFPVVMAAVIRAIDKHGDLMRMSIASPGNDFRLGACEARSAPRSNAERTAETQKHMSASRVCSLPSSQAPPAIVSTYLGDSLTDYLTAFKNHATSSEYIPQTKQAPLTPSCKIISHPTLRPKMHPAAHRSASASTRSPPSPCRPRTATAPRPSRTAATASSSARSAPRRTCRW